jgi:hypothetical protein
MCWRHLRPQAAGGRSVALWHAKRDKSPRRGWWRLGEDGGGLGEDGGGLGEDSGDSARMVGFPRGGWGGEDGLGARMVSDMRMVSVEDG